MQRQEWILFVNKTKEKETKNTKQKMKNIDNEHVRIAFIGMSGIQQVCGGRCQVNYRQFELWFDSITYSKQIFEIF